MTTDLRIEARLREIDRRLHAIGLTRLGIRWIGVPGLVLCLGVLLRIPVVVAPGPSPRLWQGALILIVAGLVLLLAFHEMREQVAALEGERVLLQDQGTGR